MCKIKVEQEAHALLTTPGATKFYRKARGHNRRSQKPSNWRKVPLLSGYRKITFCFPVPLATAEHLPSGK